MDARQKAAAAAGRVYQDFAPQTELEEEADCDTLLVHLSGFDKEQLRVQLTKTRNLVISGERPDGDNTWHRFQKTFPVPSNCDTSKVTAKFEDFILYIRLPKLMATAEKQDEEKPTDTKAPSAEKQDEEKPTDTKAPSAEKQDEEKPTSTKEPESQKPVNEQNTPNNPSLMTNPAEHINEKSNALAENAESFSEEENEEKTSDEKSWESKDSKNMPEMAPETDQKHESDSSNFATKMDGGATRDEGDLITKLKMARKMMNLVLALLLAVVIGMCVQKFT